MACLLMWKKLFYHEWEKCHKMPPFSSNDEFSTCSISLVILKSFFRLYAFKIYSELATEMLHLSPRATNGPVKTYSNMWQKGNISFCKQNILISSSGVDWGSTKEYKRPVSSNLPKKAKYIINSHCQPCLFLSLLISSP